MVGGWIASYVFILMFWSRCCRCCCCCPLPTTLVLKLREMLGTSIAAVVLVCFYFCPLDCDASVMVVDCAAVWKHNCRGCDEIGVHLDFLV